MRNENLALTKHKYRPQTYPVERTAQHYMQLVLPDNLSFYRAIANVLFWEDSTALPMETRNLGYQNKLQEVVALYLKNKCASIVGMTTVMQTNINIVKIANTLADILQRRILLCALREYKVSKVLELGRYGNPIKIVIVPWEKKQKKMVLGHATTFYATYSQT